MFLSALVFCLFVCLFAGLHKNYSDFHIIRWKGGTCMERPLDFAGNLGHVTLGLMLGCG